MKNNTFLSKLLASISLISGSIWIGASLVKLMIIYQLFEPVDLMLKENFSNTDLHSVLLINLPAFLTPFISYIFFIIVTISFLLISKISLKQNGWLFITIAIIFLTFPFEVYLMIIDYKIISNLMESTFNPDLVINLYRDRITALSSFPIIQIFSYLTILFLIIFKPLTIKNIKS